MKKFISIASAIALGISLSGAYTASFTSQLSSITATAVDNTTEIDDILPKTREEWDDFLDKYNGISTHGKYIVFCSDFGDVENIGELTFEFSGDGQIETVKKYAVDYKEPDHSEGSWYNRYVFVCEAKHSGAGTAEFVRSSKVFDNTWTIWTDTLFVDSDLNILTCGQYANGDANCDGAVTVADAAAVLQYLGNGDKYPLSPEGKLFADAIDTGDGITTADALGIQKNVLGLIKTLPAFYSDSSGKPEYGEYCWYFTPDTQGKRAGGFHLCLRDEPDKTVYKIGEELDLTGAVVTGNGGTMGINIDIFGEELELGNGRFIYDTSEFDNTKPGEYTIRVYFDTKNYYDIDFKYNYPAEITVTVVEG